MNQTAHAIRASSHIASLLAILLLLTLAGASRAHAKDLPLVHRLELSGPWRMQSSALEKRDGAGLSGSGLNVSNWHAVQVPTTVLNALTKAGVYPDLRVGMKAFRIPDSSDEFNRKHGLAQFSHLPDKRNPWRDPWWFRKEFTLPPLPADRRVWLHFDCLNYRAEVWLNGTRIADTNRLVGMFQRFDLDITAGAKPGLNALAVKICPVDHPGVPDTQTEPLGRDRGYQKDLMKDVTMVMTIGYDCMPTVPDRNMGIIQDVWVDCTGPVLLRHPFVVTELPLPETNRATLRLTAELENATASPVQGVLRGRIPGATLAFAQPISLGPREKKEIAISPKPVLQHPRLWWPRGYGEQALYQLDLSFEAGGKISDRQTVSFGVRQLGWELRERDGWHGRRILVNGRKIFARGGYVQPEILFDWDARRIAAELRYFAEANLNLIYFEDMPNPPDALLEACDRLGILFGECCYACYWPRPGTDHPQDTDLLLRCTADFIRRYRNHPSLVMYMAQNEGDTRRDLYEPWRKLALGLDGTRWLIPSATFPSGDQNVAEWFKPDLPAGMTDKGASYGWAEPAQYFTWVREARHWMFMMEGGSASVPPMSSLAKFIPDLAPRNGHFAPDSVWAHHDACHYFKPFDEALRRLHGETPSAADYAWKAHLLAADQHRSIFEAANHRLWDITSGMTQWKINACWPSVEWQVFDWYLKPMVSWFYLKKAGEPLHLQLNLPDRTVSIINRQLAPEPDLEARARVFDLHARLLWEHRAQAGAPANGYRETFAVPEPADATPVYFVKLELNRAGRQVSENCYWLRAQGAADYQALQTLPPVRLKAVCQFKKSGSEKIARVKVANPTGHIAFFVQLALTRGKGGAEILPVFWDDNYFTLLPGETREITARFASSGARSPKPNLEVGGWNVESDFQCKSISTVTANAGQPCTVLADISETFLDGSRVFLRVDGKVAAAQWAWARHGARQTLAFPFTLDHAGRHEIAIGPQKLQLEVKP
jgi:exo-1,4-beta-D-glucosaminidase